MDSTRVEMAAQELHYWFQGVMEVTDAGLFGIVPEGPHRAAVILDVLTRNARLLSDAQRDAKGKLYTPVTLVLAAGSRKLEVPLRRGHWRAAVENVLELQARVSAGLPARVALDLGSPADVFLAQLKDALRQAGLTDVPTYLDDENRRIALGLAVNWGMRFLLAYALECRAPAKRSELQDLAWIAKTLKTATGSASPS